MIPTLALVHVRYKLAAGDLLAARALLVEYGDKAAKPRVLRSGGTRRAASLDPIVSRLRDGLQALIDQHMPQVTKSGPLTLTDQAKKLLLAAYQEAMRAGFDDSGASGDGWDDEAAEQAAQARSDDISHWLVGLGAALLAGSISGAMADARMGTVASGLVYDYEQGFMQGAQSQGEVTQSEWHSEADDASCDDCLALDGQTWTGDEEHPYPGSSPFGGDIRCGPNCRCELWVTLVPADDVTTAAMPDLTAMTVADLLRLRERLTHGDD
jgi:hypothetical protein